MKSKEKIYGKVQRQEEKGITLIALVITIIVLLILVMITIAAITGPNGIMNKATKAKTENAKGEIQDRVRTEVMGSYDEDGKIDWKLLEDNIVANVGTDRVDATDDVDKSNGITFEVEKNGRKYTVTVDPDGNVTVTESGTSTGGGEEVVIMLSPGETASKTQKDNYEDESGEKATIPEGFKVSLEDHEIDTGLVVEAPDGSEFVWVPVETAITTSESDGNSNKAMAVVDPTGGSGYRGILYNFSGTTSSVMSGCTTTSSSYREPAYLTGSSGDENSANAGRVTEDGLKAEYKAMIESVDQYGGFYVGRYETSLSGSKAQSKKGETSMDGTEGSGNSWWGMYEKEKNYASEANVSSVVSSMIWGSQYDAMLNWILEGSDASKVATKVPTHSKTTTGSTQGDVMNKIYDLGNNLYEWTLEATSTSDRVARGGTYNYSTSPSSRYSNFPTGASGDDGSRLTLYIK